MDVYGARVHHFAWFDACKDRPTRWRGRNWGSILSSQLEVSVVFICCRRTGGLAESWCKWMIAWVYRCLLNAGPSDAATGWTPLSSRSWSCLLADPSNSHGNLPIIHIYIYIYIIILATACFSMLQQHVYLCGMLLVEDEVLFCKFAAETKFCCFESRFVLGFREFNEVFLVLGRVGRRGDG